MKVQIELFGASRDFSNQSSLHFDLDQNSDQSTDLPHMLVKKDLWEKIIFSQRKKVMFIIYVMKIEQAS